MTDDVAALAARVAVKAHEGALDKAGEAYIGHPARVAARVVGHPEAEAVAWLHDVVEDTGVTLKQLQALGFPDDVVAAVDAISRRRDEQPEHYYARMAADTLALKVKYADLADNTAPERLAALSPQVRSRLEAKYAYAREVLQRLSGDVGATHTSP